MLTSLLAALAPALTLAAPVAPVAPVASAAQDAAPPPELAQVAREYAECGDAALRLALLERMARLDDAARPHRDVADAVARGLDAEGYAERARAVELLGAGLHPDAAVAALVRTAKAQAREEADMNAHLAKLQKRLQPLDGVAGKDMAEALKVMSETATEMAEYLKGKVDLHLVRDALVTALPRLPDDRSVDALEELLGDGMEAGTLATAEALLTLGSADAARAVVALFRKLERSADDVEKDLKRARREKPRKKPSDIYADSVWKNKERERIAKAVERLETLLAAHTERAEALRASLAAFSTRHTLADVPREALPATRWNAWLRAALPKLPTDLGRITVPGD